LSGRKDINFYFPYWRDVLEKFLVCKYGKSLSSKVYTNQTYAIVHTKWFNYAFWMNDSIYRCILLEKKLTKNEFTLLVPSSIYNFPFVKETLSVFDFKIELIEPDIHTFISRLALPQTRKYTSSFHPSVIQSIKDKLLPHALKKTTISHFPEKIYLSRKSRGVRSLINETEVEIEMAKKGFEILTFENLSVWDQIAYMYHANWFVSNHGAGFTNCMFMKEGANVLEFLEYDFAHYGNPFPHWKLASLTNLNYFYLLGVSDETKFIPFIKSIKTNSYTRMKLVDRRIKIDIEKLKKIVDE
jgi:capsular polysaccharide biosynthesis protein